jgi:quercetin dioxygenase-like cupin family protein
MSTQAKTAETRDPVTVAPDVYRVLFENERVRLLDIRLKPGGKSPLHLHPSFVAYNLTDCEVRFILSNGETEDVKLKAGEAFWSEAVAHSVENIGKTECRALNFELKT